METLKTEGLMPLKANSGAATGICKIAVLTMLGIGTAGAATVSTLVPNGITAPLNGFVANGTAVNPSTGLPVRHLWISDHLQGLCRIDPALDSPGPFAININTCTLGGASVYDAQNQKVYIADEVANKTNQGLVRKTYDPAGDGGHGSISASSVRLGDSSSCGVSSNRPGAMVMGPDGNLYLGFLKNGNIIRVIGPTSTTVPCSNFKTIGAGTDGRRTLGLAWVGHTLYGLDGSFPWKMNNADKCVTATNPSSCSAVEAFTTVAILPSGLASNQLGATPNGNTLYLGDFNAVHKIDDPNGAAPAVNQNWASGLSIPSSITPDNQGLANPDIYLADDPTEGAQIMQGHAYKASDTTVAFPPTEPTNVVASAGDGLATVSWAPGDNGSKPTSSYTVKIYDSTGTTQFGSQSTPTASPAPTGLVVTGLTNGASYAFRVQAVSAAGNSSDSALSASVTPQPAVLPDAPQNLSGIVGYKAVALAWESPLSDGGSPIDHYTVRYHNGDTPLFTIVPGNYTGTTLSGLTGGTPYTFQVTAHNVVGDSEPSNVIELTPSGQADAPKLDVALAMTGPAAVDFGSNAVYSLVVKNTGGLSIPQVQLDDVLPASGFSSATVTTTRGACLNGTTITCNLGSMAAGSTATVTVTLSDVTAELTNNGSVTPRAADGSVLNDANAGDNTGAVTTGILPPQPDPEPITDLQINSGSASNATVGNALTYTFGLRNGNAVANNVVFTLPLPNLYRFSSASANGNACGGSVVVGQTGGTVSCNLGSLAAGASRSITITVVPTAAGTISVTGFADFAGYSTDPKQSNNTRTVSVTVK